MRVSPVNFKALACVLAVEGFDADAALTRCGFGTLGDLDDQGPWLPAPLFDHLMAAVIEVTGDPCFGLVAGKSKALMLYVALMQVTLVAPTLRRVVEDKHFHRIPTVSGFFTLSCAMHEMRPLVSFCDYWYGTAFALHVIAPPP